ncbi:MAG: hypothetical protein O7C75_06465 [Verrucomicrobia bacterium]|nr:hypothetical protein [Verrucomicrobiota bacterium]
MKSSVKKSFKKCLAQLPENVKQTAFKNFRLWQENPKHPSLHYKKVGSFVSVRIGIHYRALGKESENKVVWFWIGSHDEYDRIINQL